MGDKLINLLGRKEQSQEVPEIVTVRQGQWSNVSNQPPQKLANDNRAIRLAGGEGDLALSVAESQLVLLRNVVLVDQVCVTSVPAEPSEGGLYSLPQREQMIFPSFLKKNFQTGEGAVMR